MLKIDVTGDRVKVFRKDFDWGAGYTVYLSKKTKDGKWETSGIAIKFKKGVKVENGTLITIKNGFYTFDKSEGKKDYQYIFVMEYEEEGQKTPSIPEGFTAIDDDIDVPF